MTNNYKDQAIAATQAAFARLTRDTPDLGDIDRKVMRAFEQLMLGHPETTDGRVTAVNICAEAGISRASYYRSPVAPIIKEILDAPQVKLPENDALKQELAQLKRAQRELRHEKADEIRELRATVTAYANEIQILTLRNAELESQAKSAQTQTDDDKTTKVAPMPQNRARTARQRQ
ncbi:MAG: hypothetical protein L0H59_00815 [Tomitella sp.]|nr:hypothetical protein [Tomitella sp.]